MMLTPFFPTSKSATAAGITCGPGPAKPRASLEARVCIMHVSMRMVGGGGDNPHMDWDCGCPLKVQKRALHADNSFEF